MALCSLFMYLRGLLLLHMRNQIQLPFTRYIGHFEIESNKHVSQHVSQHASHALYFKKCLQNFFQFQCDGDQKMALFYHQ